MKYYATKGNRQYTLTRQVDIDFYKSIGYKIIPIEESKPTVEKPIETTKESKVETIRATEPRLIEIESETNVVETKESVDVKEPKKRGRPKKQV